MVENSEAANIQGLLNFYDQNGLYDRLDGLKAAGASANYQTILKDHWDSPLIRGIWTHHDSNKKAVKPNVMKCVEWILEQGADLEYLDRSGKTVLWLEMYLLSQGPDLDESSFTLFRSLVKHGANINHQDQEGNTLLMDVSVLNTERKFNIEPRESPRFSHGEESGNLT